MKPLPLAFLFAGLVGTSSAFAQSTPPCAPEPSILLPTTVSVECQCQNQNGTPISCVQVITPPDMSDCSCPSNGNAKWWQSGCLRFFTDIDSNGDLEQVPTGANTKVAFSKSFNQPETRYYFVDLITPRESINSPQNNPYFPCDGPSLICQQSGTTMVLGKSADILDMKSTLWSGQAQWFHLNLPGGNPFTSFMSYMPSINCLKIPRDLAPGKYKIARKFAQNTYCHVGECTSLLQVPADKVSYTTVNLAILGVTAPRIYDFNIASDTAVALEDGGPATAKFRLVNLGHKNILKSYVVVYASKKNDVLSDTSKLSVGAGQILANGSVHVLDPVSFGGFTNQQGVIDAASTNQADYVYEIPLTIPSNITTLVPGQKQDIYFAAKTYVVAAENNAPEYFPAYPSETDTVTITPDVEISDVTLLSSTSTQSPPELCYGDSMTVKVKYRNKGLVPSGPETKMTFLASINSNGSAATTMSKASVVLGSIPGKSGWKTETFAISLWPDAALKLNKTHYLKAKIVKAGLTDADEPKKNNNDSPAGSLIAFKMQCPFSPYGLAADLDHDGSFYDDPALKTIPPGLLVPLDNGDDNQDGVPDLIGSFNGNDPDLTPLHLLIKECKNANGSWSLEYASNRLRIYSELGQLIPPGQWQPCSGQLDQIFLKVQGVSLSAVSGDSSIRLRFAFPQGAAQIVDEILVTVFHLDLRADSNSDGLIDAADEGCEDIKGRLPRLLWFNTDDDDNDNIEDYLDPVVPGGDDQLDVATLALKPFDLPALLVTSTHSQYQVSLDAIEGAQNIAVWRSANKGQAVVASEAIALGELPMTVFVEGTGWGQTVSTLRARLQDNGVGIGSDKVRFYPGQLGVGLVSEIWAGDGNLPVSVMGFPMGTPVTMQIYKNGSLDFTTTKTVDSLLTATHNIAMDYDHSHSYSVKPGDKIKVKAVIDDGSCTHYEWWSEECVVKAGLPGIDGIELVGQPQGISDGHGLIPVTVQVKDNYGNLVEDGTIVNFSVTSGDRVKIPIEEGVLDDDVPTLNGKATAYVLSPVTDLVDVYLKASTGAESTTIQVNVDWLTGQLEPPLLLNPDGSIYSPSLTIHPKGTPLQVRLKNTNASNGTEVRWSISSYWKPDQDSKKMRLTYVNNDQSILQINDTADLLDGLCTITATYGGKFLYTAVYMAPAITLTPSIVIDKPLLNGEGTQDEPFALQWTVEKPASWPDTFPPTSIWTLASGTTYAKARGYLQNAQPNRSYLIAIENPQDQNLLAFYQQPGDMGFSEAFPGIHTDATGRATFQIASQGQYTAANFPAEFAPTALGTRQVNFTLTDLNGNPIQPFAKNSIKIARANTAMRVLGWASSCLGGDPETLEEIGVSVGFGILPVVGSVQDVGTLTKNAASIAGLRDQDANKLETTLAMAGVLTMFFPSPDDALKAALRLAKELEQTNPAFALALRHTVDNIVKQDVAALPIEKLAKFIFEMSDIDFAAVVLSQVKTEKNLASVATALTEFGDSYKLATKEFAGDVGSAFLTDLGRASEFLISLPPNVKGDILLAGAVLSNPGLIKALLGVNDSFLTNASNIIEVLKKNELFYPSTINSIQTTYSHLKFLLDCTDMMDSPTLRPFVVQGIEILAKEPTLANRYRIEAASVLKHLASSSSTFALTVAGGKFVKRKWADKLHGAASFQNVVESVFSGGLIGYDRHLTLADSFYLISPKAEDWGKIIGPQVITEFVSKVKANGLNTVRIVVPSLELVDEATKTMVEEIFATQNIQVLFAVIPIE